MCITDLIQVNKTFTTPLFWSCQCEEEYIHPATQESCPACNTCRADAPDARVDEVLRHAYDFHLPAQLVKALEAAAVLVAPELTALTVIPF